MLGLLLFALGAALVGGTVPPPAPSPPAVMVIPDEPRVVTLPDARPTVQAVAADVDGDGIRELVRLVPDASGALLVEAWSEGADGWALAGQPAGTIAGEGGGPERSFLDGPVRLIVRAVNGRDRVTLLRQPDVGCCLIIDDVLLDDEVVRLVRVADRQPVADAVHALDFDGDGTDELLATRSLPPLADVSYPTEARAFRWDGERFSTPTTTELPIGSGDTPFVLGDTDGVPGAEAGILTVTGRHDLYRLFLDPNGVVQLEAAGVVGTSAVAVPIGDGRGIMVAGPAGLAAFSWPRGESLSAAVGSFAAEDPEFLGVAGGGDATRIVVRTTDGRIAVLGLPDLRPTTDPLAPSSAAAELSPLIQPFAGQLPGGADARMASVIAGGRLITGDVGREVATLAGSDPIGLVGRDGAWVAIRHAPNAAPIDQRGGRLLPASSPRTISIVRLVPAEVAFKPEDDSGRYEPAFTPGSPLADGSIAVPPNGFEVTVEAPPGSLVYLPDGEAQAVNGSGVQVVRVGTPDVSNAGPAPLSMFVVTPSAHAYHAEWRLLVVDGPPELSAETETPFGSGDVVVHGRTAAYATVTVGGAPAAVDAEGRFSASVAMPPWPTTVSVVARDPLGNEATRAVTGVGLFDYRGLPWIPISVAFVGLGVVLLYLRVPRPRAAARPVTDDAVLEELDPDVEP